MGFLAIAGFGSLGVLARYLGVVAVHQYVPAPWGTFAVNILGCFVIGVAFIHLKDHPLSAALTIGFLGGFTTFSSYGLDTVVLIRNEQWFRALIYFSLSPLLGLAACVLGVWCAKLGS